MTSEPLLVLMDGAPSTKYVESSSNSLIVVFENELNGSSNGFTNATGFNLYFNATDDCANQVGGNTGFVTSPGYPDHGNDYVYYCVTINVAKTDKVKVGFADFQVGQVGAKKCVHELCALIAPGQ
jgi:hypothetical protein